MQFSVNPLQKEAIEHKKGPLLIIAGAGTGKTAVITKRIVELITSGTAKPSEILALTFTEKAASEMLLRVDQQMPMGYEEIQISTFHSFCDSLLRQEGSYIGLDTNYALMTQAQSYIFFRKNLYELSLDRFRPLGDPTRNVSDILKHFSRLQDEDVSPQEYLKYAKSLPEATNTGKQIKLELSELAEVYKEYTQLKIKSSKLDFGDLIITVLRLFRERPNILQRYREQFKYILVDEFQDTNYTQNVLVNMLALGLHPEKATKKDRKEANICVVGDDDQAIYKFRGAAISNILQFKQTYPDAKRIVLTSNYRSRQEILDSAYQLIKHNNPYRLEETEKVNKKLIAVGGDPPTYNLNTGYRLADPVQLLIADTGSEEADLVAKEILRITGNKDRLKDDNSIVEKRYDSMGQSMFVDVAQEEFAYKFSDLAILVRAHSYTDEFVQALKYYGIPFKFAGPKGLYTRPEIAVLISFLKLVYDYTDDISAFNILKMDIWDITPREIIELMRLAKHHRQSIFETVEQLWDVKLGSEEPTKAGETVKNTALKIFSPAGIASISSLIMLVDEAFRQVKAGSSVGEILYTFFSKSGYMESLLKEETYENQFRVQNISKFFELVKAYERDSPGATLFEYVDYINYSIDIGESPSVESDALEGYDAVNILTVHGAKGLEFPVVFMVNLVTERFPSRYRNDKIPIPEALVKEVLPEGDEKSAHLQEERRLFYVGATRAKERLYLTAGKYYGDAKRRKKPSLFLDELLDRKVETDFRKEIGNGGVKAPQFIVKLPEHDDSLDITGLNIHQPGKISYSHIDSYERCPKQYKYRYVLGLPGIPSSTFAFGRSVHATLKDFYTELTNFKEGLTGLVTPPSFERLLEIYASRWVSEGYEDRRHEKLRKDYGARKLKEFYESMFSSEDNPIALEKRFNYKMGRIVLTGSIDRIDLLGKTKDGKQEVEIIDYKTGKVKDESDVKKNLQLAIYVMVAQELFGMKVVSAGLLFVEHGKKIAIEVGEELKNEARSRVTEVVEKIKSGNFKATPDVMTCTYCDFRTICEDSMA